MAGAVENAIAPAVVGGAATTVALLMPFLLVMTGVEVEVE